MTFQWSALLGFLGLPFVLLLPKKICEPETEHTLNGGT
jgi:hypothetical protein